LKRKESGSKSPTTDNMFVIRNWNTKEQKMTCVPRFRVFLDFTVSESFGIEVVKEMYENTFEKAIKKGYEEITELVLVLKAKYFEYCKKNETLANIYGELYAKTDTYAVNNLKGKELSYYFRSCLDNYFE